MSHEIHPEHCFCQVPKEDLLYWAKKRYQENILTVDLLNTTEDQHEREVISIVACLDVEEATFLKIFERVNLPDHHILHCREQVKKMMTEL